METEPTQAVRLSFSTRMKHQWDESDDFFLSKAAKLKTSNN